MRITESQLRNIIKSLIKEQNISPVSASWISIEDVKKAITLVLEDNLWDYYQYRWHRNDPRGSLQDASTWFYDDVIQKLLSFPEIEERFNLTYPGQNFEEAFDLWIDENYKTIEGLLEDMISKNIDEIQSEEEPYLSPTDEIFGSEAGYWSYREG